MAISAFEAFVTGNRSYMVKAHGRMQSSMAHGTQCTALVGPKGFILTETVASGQNEGCSSARGLTYPDTC